MTGQRNEKKLTTRACLPDRQVRIITDNNMGLNNIELTPSTLADLYRSVLVDTNEPPTIIVITPTQPGENETNFLNDILAACKLNLKNVALEISGNNASYKDLTTRYKCKNVFLFGIEPASFGLPMNFPHFQSQTFAGISYLYSPPLSELMDDKLLKSKLWVTLKKIFGI